MIDYSDDIKRAKEYLDVLKQIDEYQKKISVAMPKINPTCKCNETKVSDRNYVYNDKVVFVEFI